jgi:hypothetical protein
MESLLAKIVGMGRIDLRSLDRKKRILRKKRKDGKHRKILLFESLK